MGGGGIVLNSAGLGILNEEGTQWSGGDFDFTSLPGYGFHKEAVRIGILWRLKRTRRSVGLIGLKIRGKRR